MRLTVSRRSSWFIAATLALALVLALTWQRVALGLVFVSADRRPTLLSDAEWDKPTSASGFQHRFGKGSSEADLLQWLSANQFKIDRTSRRASRIVSGMPCGERIAVTWATENGTINGSSVLVSEAGCL